MEIGQKIYLKPIGNAARYGKDIVETVVTKVGRKYFEVSYPCNRIEIESMKDDNGQYISSYVAYLSLQDIEDEKEYYRIHAEIKDNFSGMSYSKQFSLDQLQRILNIIKNG